MLAPHAAVGLVNEWPTLRTVEIAEMANAVEVVPQPLRFDEPEQQENAFENSPGAQPSRGVYWPRDFSNLPWTGCDSL